MVRLPKDPSAKYWSPRTDSERLVCLQIPEPLQGLKELTGTVEEHWIQMLHKAIAAMVAAGRSTMVITMIRMGICMGASPLMAYNYGAGNIPRIREILQKVAILTVGFGLLAAISCYLGRDALIGLFLKEPSNAEIGSQLMFFLIIASSLLGFYYLSSNFLQAAGNAFLAAIVSVLRQGALLIPCLYLMHCFFGLTGIAAAHTVSDVCAVMIAVGSCLWQYRKLAGMTSTQ